MESTIYALAQTAGAVIAAAIVLVVLVGPLMYHEDRPNEDDDFHFPLAPRNTSMHNHTITTETLTAIHSLRRTMGQLLDIYLRKGSVDDLLDRELGDLRELLEQIDAGLPDNPRSLKNRLEKREDHA